MKWSKPRSQPKRKSATQVALLELANVMRRMRLHGQPTPQAMENEYRQLLERNYAELAQERG
jgi:hypothetical protein